MSITWVDNVTPLNAANMTKLLQQDSVVAAATRIVASKLLGTDTQPAFQLDGNGKLSWGPGGVTAPDVTLSRLFAGALAMNAWLVASYAAATDNAITTQKVADANVRFRIQANGILGWGDGTSAVDSNLYRTGANALKTDGSLMVVSSLSTQNDVIARSGAATQIYMGIVGGNAGVSLGSANDTNLYRSAVGVLKSDGDLNLVGAFRSRFGDTAGQVTLARLAGTNACIFWGSALDTNLYRNAANELTTDGTLHVGAFSAVAGATPALVANSSGVFLPLNTGAGASGPVQAMGANSAGAGFRILAVPN